MVSPNYGWQGALGWGEETTWGTAATISKFIEIVSESLTYEQRNLYSNTIRNTRSRAKALYIPGARLVRGDVQFEFLQKGLGQWIKAAMGSVVTSTPGGGVNTRLHTFSLEDVLPAGLTIEVEKTPKWHKYTGGKVSAMTWEAEVEQILRMSTSVIGKDEAVAGSGASPSFPSANEPLVFTQGVFTVDATAKKVRSFRVTIDNRIRDDDFRLGQTTLESADARARVVSGQFRIPYDSTSEAIYTAFKAFTPAALVLTFTGSLIEGVLNNQLIITLPVVYYDGETPVLRGHEEEIELVVPFTAFKDTLNEVKVELQNTETAI